MEFLITGVHLFLSTCLFYPFYIYIFFCIREYLLFVLKFKQFLSEPFIADFSPSPVLYFEELLFSEDILFLPVLCYFLGAFLLNLVSIRNGEV